MLQDMISNYKNRFFTKTVEKCKKNDSKARNIHLDICLQSSVEMGFSTFSL